MYLSAFLNPVDHGSMTMQDHRSIVL